MASRTERMAAVLLLSSFMLTEVRAMVCRNCGSATCTTFTAPTGSFTDGSTTTALYSKEAECEWIIAADRTSMVSLTFDRFSLGRTRPEDQVRIFSCTDATCRYSCTPEDCSNGNRQEIAALSGTQGEGNTYESDTGFMHVTFESGYYSVGGTGFSASWSTRPNQALLNRKCINCGSATCTTFTNATGSFTDGSSAAFWQYRNSADCEWLIAPADASTVYLTFDRFETEQNRDKVRIYSCSNIACSSETYLETLSGTEGNGNTYMSSTGFMKVTFTSDYSLTSTGFSASWSTTKPLTPALSAPTPAPTPALIPSPAPTPTTQSRAMGPEVSIATLVAVGVPVFVVGGIIVTVILWRNRQQQQLEDAALASQAIIPLSQAPGASDVNGTEFAVPFALPVALPVGWDTHVDAAECAKIPCAQAVPFDSQANQVRYAMALSAHLQALQGAALPSEAALLSATRPLPPADVVVDAAPALSPAERNCVS